LPISTWAYTNSPGIRHVGCTAQDFYAVFGIGEDDKHIATVDADGVALAAIQGLNHKQEESLHERDLQIANLNTELRSLREEMRSLSRGLQAQLSGPGPQQAVPQAPKNLRVAESP
jgi:trimeric autotransporter adhesin